MAVKEEIEYKQRDSVELSRNAKGEYSWKVKRYYNSPDEPIEHSVGDLKETDLQLREVFLGQKTVMPSE